MPQLSSSIDDATREQIRAAALARGFVACAFVPAAPLADAPHLQAWLDNAFHGRMGYMANHYALRTNPANLEPGTQTVLSLVTPYTPLVLEDGQPRIAAYAHGDDYHHVLRAELLALAADIEAIVGHPIHTRPSVDSAPLLERNIAREAGHGWIGRSSMLIHPKRGTYTLLCELLVDIVIREPLTPVEDHCGRCRRCVDACPTGAIVGDRIVDARRCISYLTIELKDAIPRELRSGVGLQLFGCDICQAVCPWNRFAEPARIAGLEGHSARQSLDARRLLTLSREDFRALFKGSPLERTKRRGLARNAAVVLGNLSRHDDLPLLIDTLQTHDEPLVRGHVAWAIGAFHHHSSMIQQRAHAALASALPRETDEFVREEIIAALAAFPFERSDLPSDPSERTPVRETP